jgi:hypothetical protein
MKRLANMLSLYLSKHTEVVLIDFRLNLNLLVVLVGLLEIFKLDVRYVMLLKVNSYYVLG